MDRWKVGTPILAYAKAVAIITLAKLYGLSKLRMEDRQTW